MTNKIAVITFFSFMIVSSVYSKKVEIGQIDADLASIQVAAFKERKNFLNQMESLSEYDVFVQKGEVYHRIFVVNIKRDKYGQILHAIKKVFPSAFNAEKKIKNIVYHSDKIGKRKDKNGYQEFGSLNRDSILKTRKEFF